MALIQDLHDCDDVSLVGGKAASLGALLRAGFVVPDGFVITTLADQAASEVICDAYRKLAAPTIAVRSSVTTEDGSETSMAGQFSTVLNVQTECELIDAIEICRGSSRARRVRAYQDAHGGKLSEVGVAVVVQRQIVPDVAGVLFTCDSESPGEMLVEATRGVGSDVVSGHVQPDSYRIDAASGRLLEMCPTNRRPCLTEQNLRDLWALGCRLVKYFGRPQDVEWGIVNNEVFVLQTRPITTGDTDSRRSALIAAERTKLQDCGGGPWVLHNLAETLRSPTVLTWSVLRKFMAGDGGFGSIYRRVGFDPAPGEFLELILGRVYVDLDRAPHLFGNNFPFAYDLKILRHDSSAAALLPTIACGSLRARLKAARLIAWARRQIRHEAIDFDRRLDRTIIPDFVDWCRREKERDLAALEPQTWIDVWQERERRIFEQFAPEILFTNLIASLALADLRDFLSDYFWNDDPDQLAESFSSAGEPDATLISNSQLREVVQGKRTLDNWLVHHGHRAIDELDLAAPRWREVPDKLMQYAENLKNGRDPLELHRERQMELDRRLACLPARAASRARELIDRAQRYLAFREGGKHYLMLGIDLLRDMALDASRRLDADVFYLTINELFEGLRAGQISREKIDSRKIEHRIVKRIELPSFIGIEELPLLGEPPELEDGDSFSGLGISSGFSSGPVRVIDSPVDADGLGKDYVLVCTSTDPEWTPLFVNAAALVLECGGQLSHGAIVARELCIPAVVLDGATRLFRDGEKLFVDGSRGIVARCVASERALDDDPWIAAKDKPPAIGSREKFAARLRNVSLAAWSVYLAAMWFSPSTWLYRMSLHLLDHALWPIVRLAGRPGTVAIVAAGVALLAALIQAACVDNARLREGKRRMRPLREQLKLLRPGSPRAKTIRSIDKSFRTRLVGASSVCVGMLLGVFLMTFAWLRERMEISNPPPRSSARIVATVNSDFREPITLEVDPRLRLSEATKPTQSLPPIRETLEQMASQRTTSPGDAADIRRYLHNGVPPQTLTWLVHSEVAGSFPVQLVIGGKMSIREMVVYGEQLPPTDPQNIRDATFPLRSVKVEATRPDNSGAASRWPWIYLACYLPAWLFLRLLLRLA